MSNNVRLSLLVAWTLVIVVAVYLLYHNLDSWVTPLLLKMPQ